MPPMFFRRTPSITDRRVMPELHKRADSGSVHTIVSPYGLPRLHHGSMPRVWREKRVPKQGRPRGLPHLQFGGRAARCLERCEQARADYVPELRETLPRDPASDRHACSGLTSNMRHPMTGGRLATRKTNEEPETIQTRSGHGVALHVLVVPCWMWETARPQIPQGPNGGSDSRRQEGASRPSLQISRNGRRKSYSSNLVHGISRRDSR